MKFINLNFIFNLTTLFVILLISFSSYSQQLPDPQPCEDQGEYLNDENTSLFCIVCDTDYNKPTFLELYGDNKKIYLEDIQYEIKLFSKSEIEKDRGIKFFCKTGEMIPIGTLYIEPEPEPTLDPEPENEFTDEDQSTNNENNENEPQVRTNTTDSSEDIDAKTQIQNDLNKIIQIVDLYKTIEENISFLSINSRDNTRSFVERYLEIIEKNEYSRSMTDIQKQIGKLNEFYKRKIEANEIYNNLLKWCGPASRESDLNFKAKFSDNPNDTCRSFLKNENSDGTSNEDNFKKAFKFLTIHRGYLDKNNPNVPIVQKLIEYFNEELIIVSEQQNENEKNAQAYVDFTKNIQKYLAGIGYLDVKQIDGDYGPTTDKAVDKWRNERGNPNKTGKIEEDSQEFKLLEKHYNKRIERRSKWQDIKSDVIKYFDFLGYKTKNLEKTIKNFQKDYDLEVTGSFFDKKSDEFNDALFNKLKEEYQNKKNKKNEVLSEVKNIQKYLQLLGFYSGEIDGDLGKGTIKAIKKWEKENNTESMIKEDESLDKKVLKKLRNNYEEIDEEINSIKRKLDEEKNNFNNLNKELKKYFGEIIDLQNEIDNFKSVFLEKSNLPQLANIEDISELNSYSDNLDDLLKFIESFDKQIEDTKQNINALDFENINNIYKNIYKEDIKNNLPSSYARNILYNEYKKELDIEIISTQKISNIQKLDDFKKDILEEYYLKINTNQKALSDRREQLESSLPLILIIAGGIVLIAGGVLLFIFNRNQSSKKQLEQSERELRERQARIEREELEQENLRLKENIAKQAQQTTLAKDEEVEELTPEQKEEKSKTHIIQDYYNAVLDVSNVDDFKEKWEAIGLKEDQVIDHSKSRTLSIDDRSFSKANFWAVPWKNDYYIFAGRTLSKNAAALIANDYQWANELFEGIFTITDGDQFMTKARAIASRSGDVFTITDVGVVQIPKNN